MYWLLYFGSVGNSVPKKVLSERQDLALIACIFANYVMITEGFQAGTNNQ